MLLHAAKERKFKVVVVDARPLNEGLRILAAAQLASNLASVDRTKALNNHRAKMLIDHEMEVESRSPSIECVYTPLSGAATAMKDVTCVVLGASCLLSNGSMLAPAGTAVIAALAKSRHIPVIVAAESYKFSDAVQLDSIVFNELGSSSEIAVGEVVSKNVESSATAAGKQKTANSQTVLNMVPQQFNGYRGTADRTNRISTSTESTDKPTDSTVIKIPLAMPCSSCNQDFTTVSVVNQVKQHTVGSLPYEVVNLRYDLTPIHNISVVATESGLIPPTSVPVLIRELLHSDTSVSADGHDSVE